MIALICVEKRIDLVGGDTVKQSDEDSGPSGRHLENEGRTVVVKVAYFYRRRGICANDYVKG